MREHEPRRESGLMAPFLAVRWPMVDKVRWGGPALAACGGLLLLFSSVGVMPKPVAEQGPVNFSLADWKNHPDVMTALQAARRNRDLVIIEPNPGSMIEIGKTACLQTSTQAILAINQKAFSGWLQRNQLGDELIVVVFADKNTDVAIVGASLTVPVPLDSRWQANVKGKNRQELSNDFSSDLSSQLAATIEQYKQNPKPQQRRSNSLLLLYHMYKQQFTEGILKPLIRVIAVNPRWVEAKLGR